MGNCANKPLTTEGEAPEPEQKTPKAVEEREIEVDLNKVISTTVIADDHHHHPFNKPVSLAQMLENEGKKPEAEGAAKPADEKPSEPAKFEEVVAMVMDPKTEAAPKPTAEPPKPTTEPPKPVVEPPKPAVEPPKPSTEPPKPAVDPKKEEIKPVVAPAAAPVAAPATAPATVDKKVEEKKPVAK